MPFKVYVADNAPLQSEKFQVLGALAGTKVEVQKVKSCDEKKNSLGILPFLETDKAVVSGGHAAARHIARSRNDSGLFGDSYTQQGQVDSWVDFCATQLEIPVCVQCYPKLGGMDSAGAEAEKRAKSDIETSLKKIDNYLLHTTFLVGEQLTLADAVIVATLAVYVKATGLEALKKYTNLQRWFDLCINQSAFGSLKNACGIKGGPAPAAAASGRAAAPKSANEQVEEAAAAEEAAAKKTPNPLDSLPPPKMDLDEWKRTYSNSKNLYKEAMPWFWDHYNEKDYCIYFIKYQKAEGEGKVAFMTSNLLSGFLQRCEKMRKYTFGVMDVVGQDSTFDIEGCMMMRGPEIIAEMKDHPSYEYHTFTKADPSNPKDKKLVEDFWCADEEVDGKKICDSKVFK